MPTTTEPPIFNVLVMVVLPGLVGSPFEQSMTGDRRQSDRARRSASVGRRRSGVGAVRLYGACAEPQLAALRGDLAELRCISHGGATALG